MWYLASLSGAAAAIPVPGLSFAVDTVLVLKELIFYGTQLGLPGTGSATFAKLHLTAKAQNALSDGRTIAAQLRGLLAPYAVEAAVEEVIRHVPVVGLVIASGMSFCATYFALSKLLTNVEEAAKLVLMEAAAKIAADLELELDWLSLWTGRLDIASLSSMTECEFAQLTQAFLDALPAFYLERLISSLNVLSSFEEKIWSFLEGASGWSPQDLEFIGLSTKKIGFYRAQLGLAEEDWP